MPDLSLRQTADRAADAYGVPRDLFSRLITRESSWDPYAEGSAGEQGIAQLKPQFHPGVDPYDPEDALFAAASDLRTYFDEFGSWGNAAAAYNAGPKAVRMGNVPASTYDYVDYVLGGSGGGERSNGNAPLAPGSGLVASPFVLSAAAERFAVLGIGGLLLLAALGGILGPRKGTA